MPSLQLSLKRCRVATTTLRIDATKGDRFSLSSNADVLQVGNTVTHFEGTMRNLRIVRIHCEVEVEYDGERIPVDQAGVMTAQSLRAGTPVQLGCASLSMAAAKATETVAPPSDEVPITSGPIAGPKRLKVIDGGDQGRTFRLPESGTRTIGKPGQADIGLHDLYVMKVHCSLLIVDGVITVTHVDGQNGTLIDGQRISMPRVLKPGSVLRVGNSHLRLEAGPFPDEPDAPEVPAKSGLSGVMRAPPKPPPPPAKPGDALSQLEGQAFGPYQLGTLLGRGHMGAVFHATHAKTGQIVALKVLAAEFPATQAELDHFAQELKAVQQVRHPNLVTPIGAGKTGVHCWIAREFVDGESAAAVIERISEGEKPSWTRAARVTVHLARVLEALQEHRLVHGNITPRNVLLQSGNHATKLADLRLAQALDGSQLQNAMLEKKLLVELPYLAPEQTEPGGFVDRLADLYAVGAVAYALITGRPPVRGRTPEDILAEIQAGRVVRPSAFYKKVPAAFDAIVMKLLALHQENRYPSAAALLHDMEPIAESHDLKLG